MVTNFSKYQIAILQEMGFCLLRCKTNENIELDETAITTPSTSSLGVATLKAVLSKKTESNINTDTPTDLSSFQQLTSSQQLLAKDFLNDLEWAMDNVLVQPLKIGIGGKLLISENFLQLSDKIEKMPPQQKKTLWLKLIEISNR